MRLSLLRIAVCCLLAMACAVTSASATPRRSGHETRARHRDGLLDSVSYKPATVHRRAPKSAHARGASPYPIQPSGGGNSNPIAPTDPFADTAPAGTPTAADPSGIPMPVGNLPGWNQVFSDNFTTDVPVGGFSGCQSGATLMTSNCSGLPASVAAKWWAYPDGWQDTEKNGQYYPSQVLSIENGVLNYNLHTANGIHMVAAAVPKIPGGVNGGGLVDATYEIRFRADQMYGYKTAFLLWPDSNVWPADGEVDFPEGDLDGTFSAFMHPMGATSGSQQDAYSTTDSYDAWHTAVIEKTGSYVRFILDGQVVGTSTENIPSDPMHWVLQVETAIDGTVPSDDTSGNVQIAWVSVYAPTD